MVIRVDITVADSLWEEYCKLNYLDPKVYDPDHLISFADIKLDIATNNVSVVEGIA
jgi:hypothetical protein